MNKATAEKMVKDFQISCYCFSDSCRRGIDSELDKQSKLMLDAEAALITALTANPTQKEAP